MKPKPRDLEFEPEQAFENLRKLSRRVLAIPKKQPGSTQANDLRKADRKK